MKNQITLLNTFNKFLKEWIKVYNHINYNFDLKLNSLIFYSGVDRIDWDILEQMKNLTDKSNVAWSIESNGSNNTLNVIFEK